MRKDDRQVVILDDILTATDSLRIDKVMKVFEKVSRDLRIVIVACHPERYVTLKGAKSQSAVVVENEIAYAERVPWMGPCCEFLLSNNDPILSGTTFDMEEVPDPPVDGCTGETGCKCGVRPTTASRYQGNDAESEAQAVRPDPDEPPDFVERNYSETLSTLMHMLQQGLITEEEY